MLESVATPKRHRKRRYESAETKLYRYYYKATEAASARREIFQNILKAWCAELDVSIVPLIEICDVSRQNECINKKGSAPCNGGCYVSSVNPRIFMREMWGGYDTLLHEFYHHVNALNDTDAIRDIMNAWHLRTFSRKQGYRAQFQKAGISV